MKSSAERRVRNPEGEKRHCGQTGFTPQAELRQDPSPPYSRPWKGRGRGGDACAFPNSRGFTLLEVMLAVVIMAIVLVSLMGLQNRSVQDVTLAEHITTATLLAKRIMSETLLAGPLAPMEKDGTFTEEEFADYTWKKAVALTPVPKVLEVRVAVLWKEGGREEQVELVSYE